MTERLYYKDSHIRSFTAVITSCTESGDMFAVTLDKTAFFPEGGGQPGDTGYIGSTRVLDTQEIDGEVIHYTDKPLETGTCADCDLDWDLRFRRMQHHSGEHIVSGLVHKFFGYDNTGFHLGADDVTLDFNGELTRADLDKIEILANEAVHRNLPVSTTFPKPTYLKRLKYRSKLDLTENVRLVRIRDYDLCACCAPHVKRTGEIGVIKLLEFMRHRGGIRIHMAAGQDALADYQTKYANISAISAALSAPQHSTADAVERLKREFSDAKQEIVRLNRELTSMKASALTETDGNICLFEPGLDAQMTRELVNAGMALCGGICAVFCGNDKDGYKYAMGSKTVNLREKAKEINAALSGRGGGSAEMIQGTAYAPRAEIEKYFEINA